MINPIRTNMSFYVSQQNMQGGTSDQILNKISNFEYKYLKTANGLFFELDDKNKKNKDKLKYFDNGSFTVVFSIKLLDDTHSKKNWDKKYNNKLILRITTENSEEIINKYNTDKDIIGDNLLDLYLYGTITNHDTTHIGYYTLTRYYDTDFSKLNITNKIQVVLRKLK